MNFSKLIWSEPWLAPIILNFQNVIETESIETTGVTPDGKSLYYNPNFWKSLTKDEQLGVQLHEALHIANRHVARKNYREHTLWNAACDIAINYQIAASGYTLPSGALSGENDTAENIYERLLHKNNLNTNSRQNKKSIYMEIGETDDDDFSGFDSAKHYVIEGDLLRRNSDGSENFHDVSTVEAINSAVQLTGFGKTPLSKHFHPQAGKADWRTVLQSMVKSVIGDEMDYLSYEFDEFGICEDILTEKPYPKICALVDESGSIDDELYKQFLGELSKMSRSACLYASGFTDSTELNAVPLKEYRRTMTGGTDVRLAYRQACEKNFDCIIILTDGCLTFPEYEPKPTIWAMPNSFGRKREVIF